MTPSENLDPHLPDSAELTDDERAAVAAILCDAMFEGEDEKNAKA